ncbi:4-hydroxy-3-methylbut-2-enyl diphosphate reductase [Sediminispirochaeta smaragdinae]|uniref:4-hydroxy-3-methylbut-2-enyl diphosphate reductase n=1 Tax=Sediminispirochaeta smaragdinae (strain DSM 11293 / JCM 15392 / SEBR 4228) TaxID=573413 RepID=E1R5K5_SEDSS|nr:4-hydroxy-3-methylbut-2-enyl diphosphate reductase [Sediminispirochaeta smaragdinae]ADK82333.1 hydroxymethylbutenyl pyrophosphate reductase [Sediminispirochaeta smaragdinae DSM 11293]
MNRKIVLSKTMGFCFGVRRALDLVEKALAEKGDGRVVTFGPIIHNSIVLDSLARRGVVVVHSLEELQDGDRVVFRAHGVPKSVSDQVRQAGYAVYDGTCPRVGKSQKIVHDYCKRGETVCMTGDREHGEVIAVSSYGEGVTVLNNRMDVESFEPSGPVLLISQTTFSLPLFEEISSLLEKRCDERGFSFARYNTICPATATRQKALEELASEVEAIVVVGGKNSSNTRRLYEAALRLVSRAWHIEDARGIVSEMADYRSIGITAGASTPDDIIFDVEAALKAL